MVPVLLFPSCHCSNVTGSFLSGLVGWCSESSGSYIFLSSDPMTPAICLLWPQYEFCQELTPPCLLTNKPLEDTGSYACLVPSGYLCYFFIAQHEDVTPVSFSCWLARRNGKVSSFPHFKNQVIAGLVSQHHVNDVTNAHRMWGVNSEVL